MYQSFETERLLLKPTTEADAAFMLELVNTPLWIRYIGDKNVRTIEDATLYIRNKITPQFERLGFASYTLVRKSDNVKVGVCGLYDREGLPEIDLGFALLPAHERQGYACEAASEIIRAGKENFGINLLQAITTKDNIASQKLLKKLGFTLDGTVTLPHGTEELLLFLLVANT